MKLFEWHSASFENHKGKIPAFEEYLSSAWQNRNRYYEDDDKQDEEEVSTQKNQKQRFFNFTYDGKIIARNYVGVVQFEDIRIEIVPKIYFKSDPQQQKNWQLNLMYWLTYCRKFRFPFSLADLSKLDFDDFLELFIYLYANFTLETIALQPFQAYQEIEEETAFLKGRLSFEAYTRNNLATGNWHRFSCIHEPFLYDNRYNRIIKYVTKRLLTISNNFFNKEKLNEILFMLNDVTDENCRAADCDKVKLNPLFENHKNILNLCRMFLSNQTIDMVSEENNNFCFLIPMEYVFEEFLYGFISAYWPKLKIKSQSEDYMAETNRRKVFKIKNDIYIPGHIIIDAKYKARSTKDGLKSGVSQSDLYQMTSYAIKRNCNSALLIYPYIDQSMNDPAVFTIESPMIPAPIEVQAHNINITFDDITQAEQTITEEIKKTNPIFIE